MMSCSAAAGRDWQASCREAIADAAEGVFRPLLLRIADDADTANCLEPRHQGETLEEFPQFANAPVVLDLNIWERNVADECLEPVLGILPFSQQLNRMLDRGRCEAASLGSGRLHAWPLYRTSR